MSTQTLITNQFTQRYSYLLECATNILKLIKRQDLNTELVTECYMYVNDNLNKLDEKIQNGQLEQICVRWMTMQIKWKDTQFKKNWTKKDVNKAYLFDMINPDSQKTIIDSILQEENDEELILQKELEHQNKINHINTYAASLPFEKKLLYDIIYNRGINTSGKLSAYLGLSRTPSYRLMKGLKDEIRDSYTDNNIQ